MMEAWWVGVSHYYTSDWPGSPRTRLFGLFLFDLTRYLMPRGLKLQWVSHSGAFPVPAQVPLI